MQELVALLAGINTVLLGIGIRKLFDFSDELNDTNKALASLHSWMQQHEKTDDERWKLLTRGMSLAAKSNDEGLM